MKTLGSPFLTLFSIYSSNNKLEQRHLVFVLCKVSHTHLMKCHRIILHCHEIFAQVCESARINFESYRRAVKAACKCRTKDCPAWACWCYDVEGEEEQDDICHCVGCDCDVCSSCKVKSLE